MGLSLSSGTGTHVFAVFSVFHAFGPSLMVAPNWEHGTPRTRGTRSTGHIAQLMRDHGEHRNTENTVNGSYRSCRAGPWGTPRTRGTRETHDTMQDVGASMDKMAS